ncbi:hypothetical protein NUACC21_21620 [Scytonema sp. NUACC21]
MPQNSLKACAVGIEKAKTSLTGKGWSQQKLAKELQVSRQPVDKFFKGKPVSSDIFTRICKKLGLDWQEITGQKSTDSIGSPEKASVSANISALPIEKISSTYPLEEKIDAQIQIDVTTFNEYANRYTARYGSIRILGMKQDASLESIYTKVRFLDELSIRQFISLEALEQTYREGRKRRFQTKELATLDGFTVANEYQYLMVLGGPGAGKSTFLRRIGLEALKGKMSKYQHRSIPVYVELKRLNSNIIDLNKVIAEELQNLGFPSSQKFAINFLKQGKLLILLDGLDEVPKANLIAVINAIQDFVTRYDQNRYIASCRIAAHRSTWHRFRDIELADFDDEQIQEFIRNWFQSELDRETGTAEKCWETLNNRSNVAAKELAQTPLLLTFLCMVYDRTQGFPINRGRLYKKALDILLEEWAAEKRVYRDEIYQGLNPDLEKVLLSEIAHEGFINDQLFFTQEEIIDKIKTFLADTVDKPKYLDGEAVLNAIAIQQGILVERAEDIFSFSHLTVQEYLTAQYISQDSDYSKELLGQYLTTERWQEVFLLIAGSVSNADKLIEWMEVESQKYIINSSLIRNIINWADESTKILNSPFQPIVRRSLAIAFLLLVSKVDNEYVAENSISVEAFIHANGIASFLARHSLKIHSLIHSLAQAFSTFSKDVKAFLYILKYTSDDEVIDDEVTDDEVIDDEVIDDEVIDDENKQVLISDSDLLVSDSDLLVSGAINNIRNLSKERIGLCLENVESSSNLTGNIASVLSYMINESAIFNSDITSLLNRELQALRISLLKAMRRQKNLGTQVISYGVNPAFVERIRQKLLKSLNLTTQMTNFSKQDIKALTNYLYVNELIVKCRVEAVRVSREKWEAVQERMLTMRRKISS